VCANTENVSATQAPTGTTAIKFSNVLVVAMPSRVMEFARMETAIVSLGSVGWSVRRR